eukprot:SAG11_NODE_2026_length_3907_cov_14.338498_4_plen_173_part_00
MYPLHPNGTTRKDVALFVLIVARGRSRIIMCMVFICPLWSSPLLIFSSYAVDSLPTVDSLPASSPRGRTASSSRRRPLWRSGSPTADDAPAAGTAPAAAAASLRPSRLSKHTSDILYIINMIRARPRATTNNINLHICNLSLLSSSTHSSHPCTHCTRCTYVQCDSGLETHG